MRLADTEGIDAVSIRRVAADIGAAPSALYRYLTRKTELFELMLDAVAGEELPPDHSGDWRTDLRAAAENIRTTGLRHPWLPALAGVPARSRTHHGRHRHQPGLTGHARRNGRYR